MAQAVFDEHPLERYLRDVGEAPELMPGGSSDFIGHDDDDEDALYVESEEDVSDPKNELLTNWCTRVQSIVSQFTSTSRPFVERFKYDIISSSLLSTSLSNSRPARLMSESIPGGILHSRTSSVDHSSPPSSPPTSSPPEYWLPSVALAMVVIFSSAEYYFLALLSAGVMFLTVYVQKFDAKGDVSPVMDTLRDLISANDAWNSVVHEVLTLVEKDEKYSSVPSSPSSPLRVALSSTLHTTQTQSDNVRNLFAALTSPSELSQLSEMYAPPSPPPKSFFPPRPISEPGSRRLSFTSRDSKRSTWNGSYSSLAVAGSPTRQILKRREKRRSDLSALLGIPTSQSEPVTPVNALSGVQEQEEDHDTTDDDDLSFTNQPEGSTPFGMAALDLRRRRKSAGLDALGMSFNRNYVYPPRSPISTSSALRSPTASASKFTAVQPARHPLSLSSLQTLLQGTLGSKRYACAHLLALRFGEDDDEGYWEDVRSVMELLTSTFADTAARLTEALEEAERLKLRLENPSPNSLPSHSRPVSLTGQSFAPMPSHMSRFAVHVDAISSALKDAREDLDQCVDALREECLFPPSPHPALEAYERLRRELGLALRECERGRERLLDIISPPRLDDDPDPDVDPFGGDSVDISGDLPGLASDDSDKPDSSAAPAEYGDVTVDQNAIIMEERLPPPGIEQVFESEEGAGMVFHREKSKLSREERIKLVKQRRERGETALVPREQLDDGGLKVEKWGPGGEVVQELKDVIWKVGEKRRRLFNVPSTAPPPLLDSVNVI